MKNAQIAIMEAGTLATTPAGVITLGITSNENLKTSLHAGIKISGLDQELPNLRNFMQTAETPQNSIYQFITLLSYRKGNCDIQIISGEGKVFKFPAATYPLGIKPKLEIKKDSRTLSVEIEGAFPETIWGAILTAASTAQAVDLQLDPDSGADYTKTRECYALATESPIASEIATAYVERNLTIEAKEKARVIVKSTYNIAAFDKLTTMVALTIEDVTHADYIAQLAKGKAPSLLWKEGNGNALYDAYSFAAGKLVQNSNLDFDGDKNIMTVDMKGSFPLASIAGTYGTGNGGSAGDATGTTGGTLTIS